jgi:pimeloyl-ACP methyl ester carboxylesterase
MKAGTWLRVLLLPVLLMLRLPVAAADFAPCPDAATHPALRGSLCATATVPATWDAPAGEQLTLFVRKFPAGGASRGSVWAIAGGPGESGASLYSFVEVLRRGFPGFDLVVPDHRGTGLSSRVCPVEEAPASPGGTALAGAEWTSCFGRIGAHPALARQFTLTNAAHDLARLIEQDRPDGKPIYLYGVSYGTQLVLRTLQLRRLPLAGVVLDSLVPMQDDARWDLSRRSLVVDAVGRRVLAQCDADARCAAPSGEALDAVYRRALARVQADPALLAKVPGRDPRRFLGALLDMPALRARIPALVQDLARGRTAELDAVLAALPAIQATLGGYPAGMPSIPLAGIISNSENDLRPGRTTGDVAREEAPLLFTSPLPAILAGSTLPRYPRDAWFGTVPAVLPPTLVLQGTLDPKTPHDGARAHLAALRPHGPAALVTVEGAPHFILWTAPGCFQRHVRAFVTASVKDGDAADARCIFD